MTNTELFRQYYAKNREKYNAWQREYRKRNRAKVSLIERKCLLNKYKRENGIA